MTILYKRCANYLYSEKRTKQITLKNLLYNFERMKNSVFLSKYKNNGMENQLISIWIRILAEIHVSLRMIFVHFGWLSLFRVRKGCFEVHQQQCRRMFGDECLETNVWRRCSDTHVMPPISYGYWYIYPLKVTLSGRCKKQAACLIALLPRQLYDIYSRITALSCLLLWCTAMVALCLFHAVWGIDICVILLSVETATVISYRHTLKCGNDNIKISYAS